ncbi:MAG TPA: DUF1269 domain-containing protein [bacterium]|nr:DUF1269 domain-containing protein [bacterium]
MDNFVVAVFPTEEKAYEGTRALKDLHAEGYLVVYAMSVVTRGVDGKLRVNETAASGPLGTGVGALTGGLVGLFGGPAGAALGLAGGALLGSWADLLDLGVDRDFVDKVSEQLGPGKSAVVAEVEEQWVTPLDTRIQAVGGTVLRQQRVDFEADQIRQAVKTRDAELAQVEEEYRQAQEADRAALQARINDARAKLRSARERAKAKCDRMKQEVDAKIQALQEHHAQAKADAKAKREQRMAELRADYEQQADELAKAAARIDEALKP